MGTKQEPGAFDCYANAEPDEPMFVLLARDPAAPAAIRAWVAHRASWGKADRGQDAEALLIADAMVGWREEHRGR